MNEKAFAKRLIEQTNGRQGVFCWQDEPGTVGVPDISYAEAGRVALIECKSWPWKRCGRPPKGYGLRESQGMFLREAMRAEVDCYLAVLLYGMLHIGAKGWRLYRLQYENARIYTREYVNAGALAAPRPYDLFHSVRALDTGGAGVAPVHCDDVSIVHFKDEEYEPTP